MKKLLLLLICTVLLNCSVSKITTRFVVQKANEAQKVDHDTYVKDKMDLCQYLALSDEQETKLQLLFEEEKTELDKIDKDDMQMLGRNIYKYENEFRDTLNKQQLKMYKKMRPQFEDKFFYSQYSLNKIKKAIMSV